MKQRIKCIKDVVMDESLEVAFTKGETYETDFDATYLEAINNQGEEHSLGTLNDKDKWFQQHFEIIK